jgi:thiol-disulfide isomerase/thioredoxin
MRVHYLLSLLSLSFFPGGWHHHLAEAEQLAVKEHKFVLLNFSGSDWCGPCIRMHKQVFDDEYFDRFADSSLVLVNADFPRMKKNRLPPSQQEENNAMADRYNPEGKFPYTLLLDSHGKVLKDWDGYQNEGPREFAREIHLIIDAQK